MRMVVREELGIRAGHRQRNGGEDFHNLTVTPIEERGRWQNESSVPLLGGRGRPKSNPQGG